MRKYNYFIGLFFAAFFGGIVAIGGFYLIGGQETKVIEAGPNETVRFSNFVPDTDYVVPEGLNFIHAAEVATPAVVHIRSKVTQRAGEDYQNPLFEFFQPRGGQRMPMAASGSGVIVSEDGYIVTNNHVIDDADEVNVTLSDNRQYTAEVIGTDPNTDLALLKIKPENDLQYLKLANSDDVKVGEWVLAVGNPFELNSTVTAGIVSAKARNINIMRTRYGIETFIQTDAAVNPGNSGGALVNLNGDLIGINTAIASNTGSYQGYSFAVPSSLVKKVMEDLREYGVVQRPLLGVEIVSNNAQIAEQENLDVVDGVYIANVAPGGAAEEAGIEAGDVVIEIDGNKINNSAELQEMVALHRPGDVIEVTVNRQGKEKTFDAKLKNQNLGYEVVERAESGEAGGATVVVPSEEIMDKLDIDKGLMLKDISGTRWEQLGIDEGFILTKINNREIGSPEELRQILEKSKGSRVKIEGVYPDGRELVYGFTW
ncbi:Do family serine endopeptidase [Marinigracilibium pacificum]|uniref:Do family serine endopeptidase n=1 Tax=Marinigracilibium pacificum TaxID=2729599 RepID=A0A848J2P0_9BACT|nr:Do family serine endopeptidase [Marinigracilibium pacificum]NMM48754.1 Do family serine endopeptidase [Marinigracilibium pacificum]